MNSIEKLIYKLSLTLLIVFSFLLMQNHANAASTSIPIVPPGYIPPTPTLDSSISCGDPALLSNNLLVPTALTGKLYAKLPTTESAMTVNLYSQRIFADSCTTMGSATVSPNKWTYIAQVNNTAKVSTIIATGNNLEAEPYTADLDLLYIPDSNPCVATGNLCQTSYKGYNGVLQPNLISPNTSQIAMYVALPLKGVAITNVNYYADGTFIYSSKKLMPVRRDYLDGGMHSVQIQVNFAHGETFSTNQSINMGTDWTGSLILKSTFNRTKNKVAFFVFVGAIVLVVVLALALVRYIYKLHKFKEEHGLTKENLKKIKDINPDDNPGPQMHIG